MPKEISTRWIVLPIADTELWKVSLLANAVEDNILIVDTPYSLASPTTVQELDNQGSDASESSR